MASKTEELGELFKEWVEEYRQRNDITPAVDDFIEDGIIYEDRWTKAPTKVLFLARETNGNPGDYLALIRKTGARRWVVAGAWAYALQNAAKNPPFSEAHIPENWQPAFLSSAIFNLKKKSGGKSANPEQILEVAKRDKVFIQRGLEIIKADIIVCCGTFSIAKEIIPGLKEQKAVDPDGKCFRLNETLWIDFCHFSVRSWRHDMMYYALLSIYRNCEPYMRPVPKDTLVTRK